MLSLFSGQSSIASDEPATPKQTEATPKLEGFISQSETLPKLDKRLVVGGPFDESMLPQFSLNNSWYQIPFWQSRKFMFAEGKMIASQDSSKQIAYLAAELSPYKRRAHDDNHPDALKETEEDCLVPYTCWQWGNREAYIDILCICTQKLLSRSSSEVNFYDEGYSLRIDAESNRILVVNPQVSWRSTYYPDCKEQRRGGSSVEQDKSGYVKAFVVSTYLKEAPWWIKKNCRNCSQKITLSVSRAFKFRPIERAFASQRFF